MNNIAETILKNNIKDINTDDVEIIPCNMNVILSFYDENPYRELETTESGLILGLDGNKRYKSNETGEMEDSEEYMAVAKVIAVGPTCKYVNVGDDVIAVKLIAQPIPFRNKGYRAINETNIVCRIVKK